MIGPRPCAYACVYRDPVFTSQSYDIIISPRTRRTNLSVFLVLMLMSTQPSALGYRCASASASACAYALVKTRLTVKPSQAYPPRFYQWIDYLKNESVSLSRNWCQIQSGISACVMSSEYFTRTSLYLVRLKIFEWIKLLRSHLHQFQENGAGRNFITASRVNSLLITHARVQISIWNLQLAMESTFE